MAEIKTPSTDDDVEAFIGQITDDPRREDCRVLLDLMKRATGVQPALWSSGVVGFGTFHYKSGSGQEGDWFPVGFASRKTAITIYVGLSIEQSAGFLAGLGSTRPGRAASTSSASRTSTLMYWSRSSQTRTNASS